MDNFGNWEDAKTTLVKIDTVPPVITINCPEAKTYLTSESIVIDYEVTDPTPGSGVDTHAATLDGNPVANGDTIDLANMAGDHTFVVSASDIAGNEATATVDFHVSIDACVLARRHRACTLNLVRSWLYVQVCFPPGCDARLIDPTTVVAEVNGLVIPCNTPAHQRVRMVPPLCRLPDHHHPRRAARMLTFPRSAFAAAMAGLGGLVPVMVHGDLADGTDFAGVDIVCAGGLGGRSVLSVSGLAAVPTRTGAEVSFSLSAGAEVVAEVLNVAGRPVATVVESAPYEAGTHRLVWGRLTRAGTPAPSGSYLVRIRALDTDGQQAQAVCTLRLGR